MKIKFKLIFAFLIILLIFYFGIKFTGFASLNINSCSDTDFGKNYYSFGAVNGDSNSFYFSSKESYLNEDECLNNKTLLEYFCVNDGNSGQLYKSSAKYKCLDGCSEGKCLGERKTGVEEPKICEGLIWCKIKKWLS